MNPHTQQSLNDAFLEAVRIGNLVIVKNLLNLSVEINVFDPNSGLNALGIAIQARNFNLAMCLLEEGADIGHVRQFCNQDALAFASVVCGLEGNDPLLMVLHVLYRQKYCPRTNSPESNEIQMKAC